MIPNCIYESSCSLQGRRFHSIEIGDYYNMEVGADMKEILVLACRHVSGV
jgi:hypothetical protein